MFSIIPKKGPSLQERMIRQSTSRLRAAAQAAEREQELGAMAAVGPYADDPAGYISQVLGRSLTHDIEEACESVLNNPVTFLQSANAVGKTDGAAHIAVWWYQTFMQSQVYTLAAPPITNLELLLWGQIGDIVARKPSVFSRDNVSLSSLHISRTKLQFLTGVAIPQSANKHNLMARFSGKHAPYILFIADEGDAVSKEIYDAIETCISGGFARLLILFNPRGKTSHVYTMQRKKQGITLKISAFNHPNVITGKDVIPGAVTREATVRRINEWSRPLSGREAPDAECFEVPKFLVGAVAEKRDRTKYSPLPAGWRKITDSSLSHMVLAEYPLMAEDQLINEDWVKRAQQRYQVYVSQFGEFPPVRIHPIMGLDVAELGQDRNVATFRYGGFVAPQIVWAGIDTDATADLAAEIFASHAVDYCNVDAIGVGSNVAPGMRRRHNCNAYGIKVTNSPTEEIEQGQFGIIRDQMLWALREWLRLDPAAMLPDDDELVSELIAPLYGKNPVTQRIKVSSTEYLKERLQRSPDKLMSLALTFAPIPVEGDGDGFVLQDNYMFSGSNGNGKIKSKFRSR